MYLLRHLLPRFWIDRRDNLSSRRDPEGLALASWRESPKRDAGPVHRVRNPYLKRDACFVDELDIPTERAGRLIGLSMSNQDHQARQGATHPAHGRLLTRRSRNPGAA
jgi:hypothetical protein